MQIKRHRSEALWGEVIKPEFHALHLSKREQGILIAASKIAEAARCKMEAFAYQDCNDWDTEFASIEHSAKDIAEMAWMELSVDIDRNTI